MTTRIVGFLFIFIFEALFVSEKSFSSDNLGSFKNTYYYLSFEGDYPEAVRDQPVKNLKGEVIAWVTLAYKKSLDLEGSGKLKDGRVLNYIDRVDGEIRYRVTPSPWGNGVKNCELVPFRTLAVDPKKIPVGSLVYLPVTDGMKLPDGSQHDGMWWAEDIGGAIQSDRIDIFIGRRIWAPFLEQAGITHMKPLEVKLLAMPGPRSCVFSDN